MSLSFFFFSFLAIGDYEDLRAENQKTKEKVRTVPSLSLQACTPRQHNALFSHQFQLNVDERVFFPPFSSFLFSFLFSCMCGSS